MKYVIFKYRGIFMPVIIPQHVTHSQVKIEGAIPVSAGFFRFIDDDASKMVVCYGESESLKLKPHERDEHLLYKTLRNYGAGFFLTEENF